MTFTNGYAASWTNYWSCSLSPVPENNFDGFTKTVKCEA